ncbi:hypothetical protein [Aureimonas ureilytica]|uniref:hypothetical protein n=1 Tax=Aureimonas ureilytica TaxID=401562 RepID=UPI000AEB0435|nr:hypothetical protein [Aureimonas ureilytica]
MSNVKRARGRPKGTGKDDSVPLNKVADKLLASPGMTPSAAMKQVISNNPKSVTYFESTLRRLQVKWKEKGAEYMEMAHARVEAEKRRERERDASYGSLHGTATEQFFPRIPNPFRDIGSDMASITHGLTRATDHLRSIDQILKPTGLLESLNRTSNSLNDLTRSYDSIFDNSGLSRIGQHLAEHERRMRDLIDPPGLRAINELIKRSKLHGF